MIKMNITREGETGIMCFQIGQNMLPALFWPRMNNQKLATRKYQTNCNIVFPLRKKEGIVGRSLPKLNTVK